MPQIPAKRRSLIVRVTTDVDEWLKEQSIETGLPVSTIITLAIRADRAKAQANERRAKAS